MSLFQRKIHILMVCTENICRSPLAEGLLLQHLQYSALRDRVKVSSAGTRASMPGRRPDLRAQKMATEAGVDLSKIRAHRVTGRELVRSDFIIAMDRANIRELEAVCPAEHRHKISLLLGYAAAEDLEEVPDPYYGSVENFRNVFQLIDVGAAGLVLHLSDPERAQ